MSHQNISNLVGAFEFIKQELQLVYFLMYLCIRFNIWCNHGSMGYIREMLQTSNYALFNVGIILVDDLNLWTFNGGIQILQIWKKLDLCDPGPWNYFRLFCACFFHLRNLIWKFFKCQVVERKSNVFHVWISGMHSIACRSEKCNFWVLCLENICFLAYL